MLKKKGYPKYRNWTTVSRRELNRIDEGLSRTGYEYGPLTDKPDWSFADGRQGFPGTGQLRRIGDDYDIAKTVRNYNNELENIVKSAEKRESN